MINKVITGLGFRVFRVQGLRARAWVPGEALGLELECSLQNRALWLCC